MNIILLTEEEALGQSLPLKDERSQHLLRVIKVKPLTVVKAGILNQDTGLLTVTAITDQHITFTYNAKAPMQRAFPLHLVIGAARPLVMKRLLRDCTAIGCRSISVYNAVNGEKSYLESSLWQTSEWHKAVLDGLSLAKAVDEPLVERFLSLEQAVASLKTIKTRWALEPSGTASFNQLPAVSDDAVLVVGNERGFSQGELDCLAHENFTFLHMGHRIVRTETACVMALALAAGKFYN